MARVLPIALLCMAASFFSSAFVTLPTNEGATRATAARWSAVSGVPPGALLTVPGQAQAYSETELNQFGLVFAIFFLGFFIAGLVRMFTVGKL
mmetsp:Transcript_1245/g.2804  ORF Transcript_1245/g.2804 Transcript_1245/m.2804 type:complete len:93 (-) Transcript_1245:83-361(-)